MKFLMACLCALFLVLSLPSVLVSANTIDDAVHGYAKPFDDSFFGYLSSLAESLGSPEKAFANALYWQIPGTVLFAGASVLNYYYHEPEIRQRAGLIAVGGFLGGLLLQSGTAIAASYGFVSNDKESIRQALILAGWAHSTPSIITLLLEPAYYVITHPKYDDCLKAFEIMVLGSISILLQFPAILLSPAGAKYIRDLNPVFDFIGKLSSRGASFYVGSEANMRHPFLIFGADHGRNNTALLKVIYSDMNSCHETEGFSGRDMEFCKYAWQVQDVYAYREEAVSKISTGKILTEKVSGMKLELIAEVEKLSSDLISRALTSTSAMLIEASKDVGGYKTPAAVEDVKFQYFLSIAGNNHHYLIFGFQLIIGDEEFDENTRFVLNSPTFGDIPHVFYTVIIAEFDVLNDLSGFEDQLLPFFGESNSHALLFEMTDKPTAAAEKLPIMPIMPIIKEEL